MAPSRQMRIQHKVHEIDAALRLNGEYHLYRDEDSFAVLEGVRRMHQLSQLTVIEPPGRFGGEYVLRLVREPTGDDPQIEQ
ncbi:hypothetical protein EFQ99_32630 [Rhizobium vallis]|uniref:Uncharacterized protein n=2 Tax=Rhizobium TaxID=379 RepID=A0A2A6J372_9HYPH|nr:MULTISPECIES: hypothetical protein [Rhizobium]PDS28324.1 hypothetical protein CO650_26955 [Rhizobium phaseoli]PDT00515.1 hypothetical protein CO666_30235 [Rhizobium chutanense]RUM18444.1 hypothetical protein EFQ99_32630 [Rhizobium vallis]